MLLARLTPASRMAPSSVLRNSPSASTRLTISARSSWPPRAEHRVDQVVPRALVAQVHLEPVGEEGEEIPNCRPYVSRARYDFDVANSDDRPKQGGRMSFRLAADRISTSFARCRS